MGPYSAGDSEDAAARERNTKTACLVSRKLVERGHFAFCPHIATNYLEGLHNYEWFVAWLLLIIRALDHEAKVAGYEFAGFRLQGFSPGAEREEALLTSLGRTTYRDLKAVPALPRGVQ